jgi:hypothetical protein
MDISLTVVNGKISINEKHIQDMINDLNHNLVFKPKLDFHYNYHTISKGVKTFGVENIPINFKSPYIIYDIEPLRRLVDNVKLPYIYEASLPYGEYKGAKLLTIVKTVIKPSNGKIPPEYEEFTFYLGFTNNQEFAIRFNKSIQKLYDQLREMKKNDANELLSFVTEYLSAEYLGGKAKQAA